MNKWPERTMSLYLHHPTLGDDLMCLRAANVLIAYAQEVKAGRLGHKHTDVFEMDGFTLIVTEGSIGLRLQS